MKASIKMWIASGDKANSLINTAFRLHMIKDMHKAHTIMLKDDLENKVMAIRQELENHPKKPHYLIIQGGVLEKLARMDKIMANFTSLIVPRIDFALFFEMSMLNKKNLVAFLNNSIRAVTLAVGDGYNDADMIREAKIGVCVGSNESSHAHQVCDYIIPDFKDLWRLLFVHGRWSYMRISGMILLLFYRSVFFITPQIVYCWYNGYSALTLQHDWNLIYFNLLFNMVSILAKTIFDQDLYFMKWLKSEDPIDRRAKVQTSTQLKNYYPYLYTDGQMNKEISIMKLLIWSLEAVMLSLLYFTLLIKISENTPLNIRGYMADYHVVSIISYIYTVLVVDLKTGMVTKSWGWFNWIGMFVFSIGIMFIYVVISDTIKSFPSYHTISVVFTSASLYFMIIFSCGTSYIIFKLMMVAEKELAPKLWMLFRSIINLKKESETKYFEDTVKAYRQQHRRRPRVPTTAVPPGDPSDEPIKNFGNPSQYQENGESELNPDNSIMKNPDQDASNANLIDRSNNASMY